MQVRKGLYPATHYSLLEQAKQTPNIAHNIRAEEAPKPTGSKHAVAISDESNGICSTVELSLGTSSTATPLHVSLTLQSAIIEVVKDPM